MMDFHYNTIHKNFKENYNLFYSDTYSLVYSIYHEDIYEWIKNNSNHFDLSDSIRSDMKDNNNKKVLGKFKDEMNTLLTTEFLALNPKVYSIMHQDMKTTGEIIETKKDIKGVSKVVVKKEISHNDYKEVLQDNQPKIRTVTSIRSFNHQIYTDQQNKVA